MSDFLLRTARRMRENGNLAEAARIYTEILRIDSRQFEALHSLGLIYYGAGRFDDAARFLEQATLADPNSSDVWFTRGCTLHRLNRLEDALAAYNEATTLRPSFAEALVNKGWVLQVLKRYDEALAALDAALAADAKAINAYINRGSVLESLGRRDEAMAAFDAALALDPNSAEALINRGSLYAAMKRFEEAAADYEKAHGINPAIPYVLGNLLNYRLLICDWRNYDRDTSAIEDGVRDGKPVAQPLVHVTVSGNAQAQLKCARAINGRDLPALPPPLWRGERYTHDRIRIAYLSADFREHAVARLAAGLYEEHDRTRFETMGISLLASDNSPMRARIENAFGKLHDAVSQSDAEVAAFLRRSEIDIAVDLTGFTTGGRPQIFAHRAAPVQVNFLGHPGTMGASFYDYIVADRVVVPAEDRKYFAEKIVTLPHAYQCNDAKRFDPAASSSRKEAGLPEGGFVFCCFNNNNKITPDVFGIWVRLLKRIPESVLWLLEDTPAASHNLAREATARGVDAGRIIFAPRVSQKDHIARQRLADLFLDTLPYGAHTTASDALWVGLPVLTRLGSAFAGRVGASLLTAIGLPELVTRSAEEYEALALRLAAEPSLLSGIKAKLADNRRHYPLFDTKRFARNLEKAYTEMWERQRRGAQPDHIEIVDSLP